jgi:hypothetical protein
LLGSLSTVPPPSSTISPITPVPPPARHKPRWRPDAILIVMGSCERSDYVAHLGLRLDQGGGPVRIVCAWAQAISAIVLDDDDVDDIGDRSRVDATCDSDAKVEDAFSIAAPASPLARFVHDITGRRLHLACALTHCNMRPPSSTRVPPMMRLGALANKMALEDAVRASRARIRAAKTIQRALRQRWVTKRDQISIGTKLLSHLLAAMRVDDPRQIL